MSRFLILLLLIATLAGTGLVILLIKDRDSLTERLLQSGLDQKRLESELAELRQERDRLLTRVKALPTVPAPQPAIVAPAASASSTKPASDAATATTDPGRRAFAEMMKNPAMKEMMKKQQLAAMEMQYAGLFTRFQLSDEEKADFKTLLGERVALESELGLEMLNGDLTKEQRSAMVKDYEASMAASDERIRDFLNDDNDYAAFKHWEDTKPERMQLDMGRSLFSGSGEPLTPQQEEQLVEAMHRTRMAPSSTPDLSRPENFDPSKLDNAGIDQQLARFDANAQSVLAAAGQFLTPKQLDSLRTLQQQWRAMSETGLRMSTSFFVPAEGKGAK